MERYAALRPAFTAMSTASPLVREAIMAPTKLKAIRDVST